MLNTLLVTMLVIMFLANIYLDRCLRVMSKDGKELARINREMAALNEKMVGRNKELFEAFNDVADELNSRDVLEDEDSECGCKIHPVGDYPKSTDSMEMITKKIASMEIRSN